MMKLYPILAFTLLISALAFAEPAQAKDGKEFTPPCKINHDKFMKEEIGLTDDQQKKLEAIRLESAKEAENFRHQIEVEKLAVKELAVKGTLTKPKLKESLKKIEDARGKMATVRFQGAVAAVDILTDDQIKKIADKRMLNMLMEGREGRAGHDGPDCMKGGKMGCPLMEKGKMEHRMGK